MRFAAISSGLVATVLATFSATAHAQILPRIVGGSNASDTDFPALARLSIDQPGVQVRQLCMATIISDTWLLTTATCFFPDDVGSELSGRGGVVVYGTNKLDSSSGKQTSLQSKIYYPDDFVSSDKYHMDIALVKTNTPMALGSSSVKAAKISTTRAYPGMGLTVAGYGITNSSNLTSFPSTLQKAPIALAADLPCVQQGAGYYTNQNDVIQCYMGAPSACMQDVGSPLFYKEDDGTISLMGLSSFLINPEKNPTAPDRCTGNGVGKYATHVSPYLAWIVNTTGLKLTDIIVGQGDNTPSSIPPPKPPKSSSTPSSTPATSTSTKATIVPTTNFGLPDFGGSSSAYLSLAPSSGSIFASLILFSLALIHLV
ncbi:trypsin-like serine protease [Ramicandelaber brevisporus]|nr:trypsin-like serine protease [Ramicandelaber brevisporus]